MRHALIGKPRWVVSVVIGIVCGLCFGGVTAALSVLRGGSPLPSLVGGVVGGLVFGLGMGWILGRQAVGLHAPLVPLSPAQRREALRAATRGPVPSDEEVRRAAVLVAEHQQRLHHRSRWTGPVVGGLMSLNAAALAVVASPWWLAALLVFVPLAFSTSLAASRGRRRLDVLRGERA